MQKWDVLNSIYSSNIANDVKPNKRRSFAYCPVENVVEPLGIVSLGYNVTFWPRPP